jgi:serine/threonine-protein kinase
MPDGYDREVRIIIAEGLLSRHEAEALLEEARRLERSPLELLRERGRLSEDSLVSLRREAREGSARPETHPETDDSTITRVSSGAPVEETPGFPVAGWDRYQYVRLLGEGGMGRVFLAVDPRLRRHVALKFVREDAPDLLRRFVFEARAQARVVHERVCEVYEVGEVQGKTYIAMRYVEGQPLHQLAGELTPEQKAMVLREAAEGVHAAHRAGLIHRDIKPSNILVERTAEGHLAPYVMDFGLARDWKEGVTATGSVLGTPHYMAPEQARGEVARLDRRADVYSLGATLYHLLTGAYPVPGANTLEVLSNIATVEPRPPRALDPDIPADLEAIVLKCLEKDRSVRYDSARALAEDLDRFLNGEPVRARPAGPWYRLRKKIRKHRVAVSLSAAALVLVSLSLSQAALERREASRGARLASRFTAKAKDIEHHALVVHLSPPHDTRPARKQIQSLMDALKAEQREAGALGEGPGHHALGQGFLALGDETRAREHLEAAWERGYQEPQVAYSLALVLGRLYQQQLLEAERGYQQQRGKADPKDTSPQKWLEARKRDLEKRLRDPALMYLRRSEGAPVPSHYVAALLAFLEGRFADALARLDALGEGPPGFYAAPRLRGDIFLASATRHGNQGRYEQARAAFSASRRAYERAAEIGRSDPAVHHALARLELALMEMERYSRGEVEPPYQRGLRAVARALEVAPDHYASWVLESRFHRLLAGYREPQGGEILGLLQRALQAARTARELAPERPEARLELGWLFRQWGQSLQGRNEDPREQLRLAREAIEDLAPRDQEDHDVHRLLGLIYKDWADHEEETGGDPLPWLGKAIDSYRLAIRMDESQMSSRIGLATAYLMRATQPHGPDPDGDLEWARKTLEEARSLNPQYVLRYFYEGRAYTHMALRSRARGGDARPALEKSIELYRQGLALNDKLPYLLYNVGVNWLHLAREAWEHGGEPGPLLDEAQGWLERAILVAPKDHVAYGNLGWMHAQRAEYLRARGGDPGPSVRAAQKTLGQASERVGAFFILANLGRLHHTQAVFELEHGRDPSQSLAQASRALSRALDTHPKHVESALFRAKVGELRARWKARRGQAHAEDFEEAERLFRQALDLNPANQDSRLAFGHFLREWVSWKKESGQEPGPLLKRGLTLVEELLKEREGSWPEARVLRASFLLLQAEGSAPSEQQRQWRQAREELTRALADNPNLEHAWKHLLPRVRQPLDAPGLAAAGDD